jgi:hypothetical protein
MYLFGQNVSLVCLSNMFNGIDSNLFFQGRNKQSIKDLLHRPSVIFQLQIQNFLI